MQVNNATNTNMIWRKTTSNAELLHLIKIRAVNALKPAVRVFQRASGVVVNHERALRVSYRRRRETGFERNLRPVQSQLVARRLPAGDVLFEKVRVLQADELDGESIFEVANHPARCLADGHCRADLGPMLAGNGSARLRDVDDPNGDVRAVWQNQTPGWIAWGHTAVTTVLRQAQNVAIGEPGELGGELVALARGGRDRHGKAILELPSNDTFQPADMVD